MIKWMRIPLMVGLMGLLAPARAAQPEPAPAANKASETPDPAAASKPAAAEASGDAAPQIQWRHDYKAALADAKKSGKPIMIDFYTDWCTWCKVLDKKTYTDPGVVAAAEKLIPVKINAEEDPSVASQYDVTGYPCIVFLSSEGKVLHRIEGYKPADAFLPDMKAVLQGKSPKELAQELMDKGTTDPDQQLWVASKLLEEDKTKEAIPWMEKAAAGLPDAKKVQAQSALPFLYLANDQKEKAEKAFDAYKNNPKADPEMVAEDEMRFAYRLKDRKRMETAIDRMLTLAKDPRKKAQIQDLKDHLDQLFANGGKKSNDAASDAGKASAGEEKK